MKEYKNKDSVTRQTSQDQSYRDRDRDDGYNSYDTYNSNNNNNNYNNNNNNNNNYNSNNYNNNNYNNNNYDNYNNHNGFLPDPRLPGETRGATGTDIVFRDSSNSNGDYSRQQDDSVVVRSNTIVGDPIHKRGMVVAKIVKGNIPVQNGVVHLIDKPLMIVARSLYEYIMVIQALPFS